MVYRKYLKDPGFTRTLEASSVSRQSRRGFTLIELLVVVAIISLLSSVVLSSLSGARERAQIVQTQQSLNQLRTAFVAYDIDNDAHPPGSDLFTFPEDCTASDWSLASDALVDGGYLTAPIEVDPWGNQFCYDNNFYDGSCDQTSLDYETSPLWSKGPNGTNDTDLDDATRSNFSGDDIGIVIEPRCAEDDSG